MGLPTPQRYGRPGSSRRSKGREIGCVIECGTLYPPRYVVPPTWTLFTSVSYERDLGFPTDWS